MGHEYYTLRLKVFLLEILGQGGNNGAGTERTYFLCEIATL